MNQILSVLVENKSGVLAKVVGLFARRRYNIISLAVGETEDKNISRITIVSSGDDLVINQIKNQVQKLISVKKVILLDPSDAVMSELCLVKVNASMTTRSEIMQIVNIFRAKIVDVSLESLTIEITGENKKIEGLIAILFNFGIIELTRSGAVAVERGTLGINK